MNTQAFNLKEYLRTVYEVETSIYEQEEFLKKLNRTKDISSHTIHVEKKNDNFECVYKHIDTETEASQDDITACEELLQKIPKYELVSNICRKKDSEEIDIYNQYYIKEYFYTPELYAKEPVMLNSVGATYAMVCAIIFYIISVFFVFSDLFVGIAVWIIGLFFTLVGRSLKKSVDKANLEARQAYESQLSKYQAELAEIEKRKKRAKELREERDSKLRAFNEKALLELSQKASEESQILHYVYNCTIENINEIEKSLAELYETRKKLYDMDIIFSKYRNLPAVATFLEYINTGRCTEFEGAHGAYNLYESELRQDIIITKLDDVIEHLKKIERTQYLLYQAIMEVNENLSHISDQLKDQITLQTSMLENQQTQIQMQSAQLKLEAITASCTAATAANTEALKYIALVN